MTPPAWWRPTSHVLPGELTLTGLIQKKLGEVVVMHCPVCAGFSRHGWRSFDLCVAFRGDTLYWVGARIKCFEAVGGSSYPACSASHSFGMCLSYLCVKYIQIYKYQTTQRSLWRETILMLKFNVREVGE